jgi:sulfur carrier protein ThiS adenylyltransferase
MNILEQGLLTYLNQEQLKKIQSMKIGIGGAGGLGSNTAMMLVRTGFNNFEIVDYDVIEPSNLNRQQFFADEVGLSKVDVLKKRLLQINPDLRIIIHKTKWSTEIGNQFFQNCDFIIEAFDQADWKKKFVDYYHDKTKYIISGNGMAGLLEKKPLQIRRIGNIYIAGDGSTDTHQGHPPMAPRVTACAAMMAEIVLDLTLTISTS